MPRVLLLNTSRWHYVVEYSPQGYTTLQTLTPSLFISVLLSRATSGIVFMRVCLLHRQGNKQLLKSQLLNVGFCSFFATYATRPNPNNFYDLVLGTQLNHYSWFLILKYLLILNTNTKPNSFLIWYIRCQILKIIPFTFCFVKAVFNFVKVTIHETVAYRPKMWKCNFMKNGQQTQSSGA